MKKLIIASALALTPFLSYADTGPGCGWGAILFEGKDGLVSNVLAATTNGTLGNQTFGMTSGTAGCDGEKTVTMSAAGDFLNNNMERVAKDMAIGGGESLETLAGLLGINESDKSTFFNVTQQNFTTIFNQAETNSKHVLTSLKSVMQSNASLSKYVI